MVSGCYLEQIGAERATVIRYPSLADGFDVQPQTRFERTTKASKSTSYSPVRIPQAPNRVMCLLSRTLFLEEYFSLCNKGSFSLLPSMKTRIQNLSCTRWTIPMFSSQNSLWRSVKYESPLNVNKR